MPVAHPNLELANLHNLRLREVVALVKITLNDVDIRCQVPKVVVLLLGDKIAGADNVLHLVGDLGADRSRARG
jgi:hypothetical protein